MTTIEKSIADFVHNHCDLSLFLNELDRNPSENERRKRIEKAAPLLYNACKELIAAVPIQNHACCGHEDYNCAVMVNALTQAKAAIAVAEKGE